MTAPKAVGLVLLTRMLEALAEECLSLGTPFAVRRKIKAAILVLPTIEAARKPVKERP